MADANVSLNTSVFESELKTFQAQAYMNQITPKIKHLNNSKGKAIDEINTCIDLYETYCDQINELYSATEFYLKRAYSNSQKNEHDMANQAKGMNKG